jgi:hypothetical protein
LSPRETCPQWLFAISRTNRPSNNLARMTIPLRRLYYPV